MLTWKDIAKASIMTPQELLAIHDIPHSAKIFRQGFEPYARPNSAGRFPALHSSILEDLETCQNTGRISQAAFLKACLQRRVLDGNKAELLRECGISDAEIMLHHDALLRGLKPRNVPLFSKIWHELNRKRPWPWDPDDAEAPNLLDYQDPRQIAVFGDS